MTNEKRALRASDRIEGEVVTADKGSARIRVVRGRHETFSGAVRHAAYRQLDGWGKQRVERHGAEWWVGR